MLRLDPDLNRPRLWLLLAALLSWASPALAQGDGLRVGHWVELKGALVDGRFVVSGIEVQEPGDGEELIGTVERVAEARDRFWVLGQEVHVDPDTKWKQLSLAELEERRVKVEGEYKGPRKFSAEEVGARDPGRDRITGRIDRLAAVQGGIELGVMSLLGFLPDGVELESDGPLDELALAEARVEAPKSRPRRDEDDLVPPSFRIGPELYFGARFEYEHTEEWELDLDDGDDEDRRDDELSLRAELLWTPTEDFYALVGSRHRILWREDEQDGSERDTVSRLAEAYGYLRDVGLQGLDLQVGRQDFDEDREWLWDQNLDALRLIYGRGPWRMELSGSTTLSEGSPRDEATDNYIGYLTYGDEDRLLGAYVIDRRDYRGEDDLPLHLGVRALGEWVDDHDLWAELSFLRGYTGDVDLEGYAYDLGTTWSPDFADPWYLSVGYAFGSGDDDPGDDVDENYRQTGLHDNNGKFGGVTSFRYYGEVVDPELSNLSVWTLGVGRRFGKRVSLDLVAHTYTQDVATDSLRDSDLDRRPSGDSDDLGWGLDLVLGHRQIERWDFELVLGSFEPGDAFPDGERAYLAAFQVRLRL